MDGATAPRLDPAAWQQVLDRHAALFEILEPGSAAALIAKPDWDAQSGQMLEWRMAGSGSGGGIKAALQPWAGAGKAEVDLLFVGLRDSFARLESCPPEGRFSLLKDLLHEGEVLFYVMKTKCKLIDAGWEDFLDQLGLAFMGACR
jgi:hypothetical protein